MTSCSGRRPPPPSDPLCNSLFAEARTQGSGAAGPGSFREKSRVPRTMASTSLATAAASLASNSGPREDPGSGAGTLSSSRLWALRSARPSSAASLGTRAFRPGNSANRMSKTTPWKPPLSHITATSAANATGSSSTARSDASFSKPSREKCGNTSGPSPHCCPMQNSSEACLDHRSCSFAMSHPAISKAFAPSAPRPGSTWNQSGEMAESLPRKYLAPR
mmetsp:Transcript_43736/g.136801  ORF Transcript_43736/g.136801 Transcript_43736/m.136801 type:complete len:220 (+) Transcript_43736:174-833(+)